MRFLPKDKGLSMDTIINGRGMRNYYVSRDTFGKVMRIHKFYFNKVWFIIFREAPKDLLDVLKMLKKNPPMSSKIYMRSYFFSLRLRHQAFPVAMVI